MNLRANIQTCEVEGGFEPEDYIGEKLYADAKLHYADEEFGVVRVPGYQRSYQEYYWARTVVCRVTSRKGDILELDKLFEFPTGQMKFWQSKRRWGGGKLSVNGQELVLLSPPWTFPKSSLNTLRRILHHRTNSIDQLFAVASTPLLRT